jgi:hypothetical protein
MKQINLNCGKNHQQYRIVAECSNQNNQVALAGFCAEEHTESMLFRHLQNVCLQSDGNLNSTHLLLCSMMQQWKSAFNIPASQMLNIIGNSGGEKLTSVCLYRTKNGEAEKLINRINM